MYSAIEILACKSFNPKWQSFANLIILVVGRHFYTNSSFQKLSPLHAVFLQIIIVVIYFLELLFLFIIFWEKMWTANGKLSWIYFLEKILWQLANVVYEIFLGWIMWLEFASFNVVMNLLIDSSANDLGLLSSHRKAFAVVFTKSYLAVPYLLYVVMVCGNML